MESIGPYRILNEVARGGMGVVYRAQGPEGVVAIKVLLDLDPDSGERFEREARIAESLVHPNVVRVREHGVVRGRPYLVMDYVEGEDLMARIKRDGPLPEVEARRVFASLARGLQAAHAHGIVHRDLKPQNVLLRGEDVLLSDFGLARRGPSTLTATGELLGTPAYMAPEQALGERGAVGAPADVYGLGATLYAALSGGPPHRAATLMATLDQVLNAEPTPLEQVRPGLDADLAQLVRSCLRKDQRERPTLPEVLERLESSATPRGQRPLVAAAGTALLLIGALAWGASASSPSPTPGATQPAGQGSPLPLASQVAAEGSRYVAQAEEALAANDYPAAHRASERALAAELPRPAALRLVEVLLSLGRFEELLELTAELLPGERPKEVALLRYASARARGSRVQLSSLEDVEARWDEVRSDLEASLEAEPSARGQVWLGKVWLARTDRERAALCLQRARALSPSDPSVILLAHDLGSGVEALRRPLASFEPSELRSFELGLLVLSYTIAEGLSEDSPRAQDLAARLREMRPQAKGAVARTLALALIVRAEQERDLATLRRALPYLEQALSDAPPGSLLRGKLLTSRGESLVRLGERWGLAARDLREALAIAPTPRAHHARVVANQCLAQAVLVDWNTKLLEHWLGEARASLSTLQNPPGEFQSRQLLLEGHLAAQSLRFAEAEGLFWRCYERVAPRDAPIESLKPNDRRDLAAVTVAQGRCRLVASALGVPGPKAVEALERAEALDPTGLDAKIWLAHALMEQDPKRAEALAREVLAAPGAPAGKVRLLLASKAKAWEALREFLALEPGNPRILGVATIQDPVRVEEFLKRAPKSVRDHPLLLLANSRRGRRAGRVPEKWARNMEAHLGRALVALPEATWLRVERGLIRLVLEDRAGAKEDLGRAQREWPRPEIASVLRELNKRY